MAVNWATVTEPKITTISSVRQACSVRPHEAGALRCSRWPWSRASLAISDQTFHAALDAHLVSHPWSLDRPTVSRLVEGRGRRRPDSTSSMLVNRALDLVS